MKPSLCRTRRNDMRVCVLLVMCVGIMPAQQKKRPAPPPVATNSAAAPATFPLEIIRVLGNRRIPKEKIIAAAGMKIGAPVVKEDFDAARARLLAAGAFESVGYEFKPS